MKNILNIPLFAGILCISVCNAQSEDPQQKQGSVFPEKNSIYNFNTGNLPAATVSQLKLSLEKIKNIIIQDPLLNPPVGFNAVYNKFDLPLPSEIPWQRQAPAVIDIGLPEFYLDPSTHSIKAAGEAFADINIEINSFRKLYDDTYSRDIEHSDCACPIFFFRYNQQLKDSTHDYIEYRDLNDGTSFRIISNGRPVFVPLKKAQYLAFKIQYDKKNADDATDSYMHDSVTIAAFSGKQTILGADRQLVRTWQERLNKHRQILKSLNDNDKNKPAYIVWGASGNADNSEELSAEGDQNAQELWTINPDYFNKSLSSPSVQIIIVKPEYQTQMASDFIKTKVMDIYRKIDYKSLKALIQN